MFLNPIINGDALQQRYDMIEVYKHERLYDIIRKCLDIVYDVERLHRRVQLKLLHPCELNQIYMSVCGLLATYELIEAQDKILYVSAFKSFIEEHINLDEANKFNQDTMDKNFFNIKDG
jgi:DNA mismatch repair protein MutS